MSARSRSYFTTIDRITYEWMAVPANTGYVIHAPGMERFNVSDLAEARDHLLQHYSKENSDG